MNDEAVREKLVAAMEFSARGNTYAQWTDTIMPTIREIVAEELREAAEESTYWVMTRETVYTRLNEHADALTKPPDGPVR